jgi:hypothetical protein
VRRFEERLDVVFLSPYEEKRIGACFFYRRINQLHVLRAILCEGADNELFDLIALDRLECARRPQVEKRRHFALLSPQLWDAAYCPFGAS